MDWAFVGRQVEKEAVLGLIRDGGSALVAGPAGVGKTRLVQEVQTSLESTHHIERLIGSPSVRELPFGAVAHLREDLVLPDPAMLIRSLGNSLLEGAGRKPLVVIVDDIDQLDDGSAGVVHHLLRHRSVPVLATARTEAAGEPGVVNLWKDDALRRIDLGPLSRGATEDLSAAILGGVVSVELQNEVWRLSEGHPLFVREMLIEAVERRTVVESDAMWTVSAPLESSPRVAEIVSLRTGSLVGPERDGLRSIALCEPVPVGVARRLAPDAVLESLEEQQFLRAEATTGGQVLRTSHPLVGEITLREMPAVARAAMTARIAGILLDAPTVSPNDTLRAAVWLLDAGEIPPREVSISGALVALRKFDPQLGERLARAALAAGPSQEATVLLGRALAGLGDVSGAISMLQDAQAEAGSEPELASASVALAEVCMFNLGDPRRAVGELGEALERVHRPGLRAELNSQLTLAAGITGDFDLALRTGAEVVDDLDLPGPAQLRSLVSVTLAQTMTGRLERIWERLDRGEALGEQLADTQPFGRDQVGMNRLMALQAVGRFAEHDQCAEAALRRPDALPGPWLFVKSFVCQFTGAVGQGRRLCSEAELQLREVDPLGLEPMAHAIRALFEAMTGQPDRATDAIRLARDDPRGSATRVLVWADRAEAWLVAARGEHRIAAERAVEVGQAAIAADHNVWGAFALHDAVRFGQPELAVAPLRDLAERDCGPLVALLADHANAAALDREALPEVAARSQSMGATAVAAECYAAAATNGAGSVSGRYAHLATQLGRRCDGLTTPVLASVVAPLTARQEEIAALAAVGYPSKEIGERTHVSVRTVDNHLRTVYRVLGVGGREELAALFPTDRDDHPSGVPTATS